MLPKLFLFDLLPASALDPYLSTSLCHMPDVVLISDLALASFPLLCPSPHAAHWTLEYRPIQNASSIRVQAFYLEVLAALGTDHDGLSKVRCSVIGRKKMLVLRTCALNDSICDELIDA